MIRSFAIALGLAAASLGAQAKTIAVTAVLDASTVTSYFNGGNFYQGAPFTLETGDVVRLDLSFLPGQALQLQRAAWVGFFLQGDGLTLIEPVVSVMGTFTGLAGAAHNPVKPEVYGILSYGDLGASVDFSSWQTPDPDTRYPVGTISFTGISIEMTVLDGTTLAGDNFYAMDFWSYAMDSATAISVVPEPTEALLLSLGLVALTGAARRRAS